MSISRIYITSNNSLINNNIISYKLKQPVECSRFLMSQFNAFNAFHTINDNYNKIKYTIDNINYTTLTFPTNKFYYL